MDGREKQALVLAAAGAAGLAVARALYVPEAAAAEVLASLQGFGLLTEEAGSWQYAPSAPEAAKLVDLLAETYSHALIPVTNLVHGNPLRLRRFADAFKFRKDG